MLARIGAITAVGAASLLLVVADAATAQEAATGLMPSQGSYRLPFADGTQVKVFDDFSTHRPIGRIDLYAIDGKPPYAVVAAADGRIVAIQDGYSEQQSGRAAKDCHNNYVWIEHPNGEWTNYSHLVHGSVTGKAGLKVGDSVSGCSGQGSPHRRRRLSDGQRKQQTREAAAFLRRSRRDGTKGCCLHGNPVQLK